MKCLLEDGPGVTWEGSTEWLISNQRGEFGPGGGDDWQDGRGEGGRHPGKAKMSGLEAVMRYAGCQASEGPLRTAVHTHVSWCRAAL